MDTLYRNYEILSEFYQKYFVDLRILDLTCDPASLPAPKINNGKVSKYMEVSNYNINTLLCVIYAIL